MNQIAHAPVAAAWRLTSRTVVRLASAERGRAIVGRADGYSDRLGPFDVVAKTQGRGPHSRAGWLHHASAQIRPWTATEAAALGAAVAKVAHRLRELDLCPPLPAEIDVVKSTLLEEGGMNGYTRGRAVVLREGVLDARTFAHELFHLITRHHPSLRARLYGLLGTGVVAERRLPAALEQRRITNPDAPANDTVIEVRHRGSTVPCLMLILARSPYRGGPLRSYLHPVLTPLADLTDLDGQPTILTPDEVDGLVERLGTNTAAVTHPEEISAEHFAMLVEGRGDFPRPDLVAGLWRELREHGA